VELELRAVEDEDIDECGHRGRAYADQEANDPSVQRLVEQIALKFRKYSTEQII